MKKIAFLLFFLVGCDSAIVPTYKPKITRPQGGPPSIDIPVPSGTLTSIVTNRCFDCHKDVPFPAKVAIYPGTPWILNIPTELYPQGLHTAIATEPAPANRLLPASEKQALINWIVGTLGAEPNEFIIPQNIAWNMAGQLAGKQIPGDGAQSGAFFGFRVEDNARTNGFRLENFTDRDGITKTSIAFRDTVPVTNFTQSDDPVNYIFVDGLKWNGRIKDFTVQGYMQGLKHQFVSMHIQEMKQGVSPCCNRTKRTYVRLQVHRDGHLGLRGKKEGVTDDIETIQAWNTATDPLLIVDGAMLMKRQDLGLLFDDKWWFVKFWSYRDASGVHYRGQVWDKDPAIPGAILKGEVGALRSDVADTWGSMSWGSYERPDAASHKKIRFAEWTLNGTLHGGGTSEGGCRPPCELDRPER